MSDENKNNDFENNDEPIENTPIEGQEAASGSENPVDPNAGVALELFEKDIVEELHKSYLEYAMSVIVSRALPDVRDGLKPVQRRILAAMNDLNLMPNSAHRKSAKIAGDTSGNYHPHGEMVIYPTMVRMAQDFNSRYPLIDGQGNMGSIDGDPPAAMRYTEMRMSNFAVEMLTDLDKDTVEWQENYDQTRNEPMVLPARFPNLLANGSSGIAVGMATNIPPHNLKELCDGMIYYVDNPDCSADDLMQYIKGPDFPTGGIIQGLNGIKQYYETGRGAVIMTSVWYEEELDNGKPAIIITELPYQVNKAALIKKIALLAKDKKIEEIVNIEDHSDKDGMRIQIELKKGSAGSVVINKLEKHTEIKKTFGVIMLGLVKVSEDKPLVPKILSLKEMIKVYIDHRREIIIRRTKYNLRLARRRAHIIEGLVIAEDNIDEVISIIRNSESSNAARITLMERFSLTWQQATAILDMQLRSLAGLERSKLEGEFVDLLKKIAELENTFTRIDEEIKIELERIKAKYGDNRRTRIIAQEYKDRSEADYTAHEQLVVSITREDYIKKVSADNYKTQSRTSQGKKAGKVKIDDGIAYVFVCESHDYILFFTDKGKVYCERAYNIGQNSSREAQGKSLINFIKIEVGERVNAVMSCSQEELMDKNKFLILGTLKGEVKRVAIDNFQHIRSNGIKVFNLEEGDMLRFVCLSDGNDDVIMVSNKGQSIRFNEQDVRASGRTSGGVRGFRLKQDDRVVSMCLAKAEQEGNILCVTELGLGKQSPIKEYRIQKRGGSGIKVMKCTDKTGFIIGAAVVYADYEFFVVNDGGKAKRLKAKAIRETGRNTQGVKIINLKEGETLISMDAFKKIDFDDEKFKDPNALDLSDPNNLDLVIDDDDDEDEAEE